MLANLASSLILHKRIETTVAKAKALRVYVEPLITKCKDDTTHSRRVVFSYLKQKEAVTELFRVVAPKISERPGGYTRILKTGFRQGDAADTAIIELVDFNETALAAAKQETKKATTRRSRSKKSDKPAEQPAEAKAKTPVKAKAKAKEAKPEAVETEVKSEVKGETENTETKSE
jgi:large subunit ribosomal protein L17